MSAVRCPACRAENAQGPQCRRCKADLGMLFALEGQRAREMAAARRRLARGEFEEARRHAESADGLRSDDGSRRLAAVLAMLCGDVAGAWRRYQEVGAG